MAKGILSTSNSLMTTLQRIIMGVTTVAFSVLIFVQVVIRYALDLPLYGIEEISVYLAVWLYFTGSGYGVYRGNHISASIMDLVLISHRARDMSHLVVAIISLVLSCWIMWLCLEYFQWSLKRSPKSPELRLPLYYVHFTMVFGMVLMCFYSTIEVLRRAYALINHETYLSLAELDDKSNREQASSEAGA